MYKFLEIFSILFHNNVFWMEQTLLLNQGHQPQRNQHACYQLYIVIKLVCIVFVSLEKLITQNLIIITTHLGCGVNAPESRSILLLSVKLLVPPLWPPLTIATNNSQGPVDHQCSIFWQEYVGFDFEFVKIKLILALM